MDSKISKNSIFRINEPDVVYEVMGEEVVILDLKRGCYYSVNDTGAKLLLNLVEGASLEELLLCSNEVFELKSEKAAQAEIQQFVEQLVCEGIMIAFQREETASANNRQKIPSPQKVKFSKPAIEKYTDLEDLLLLDPIHDVNQQEGWPQASKER
jgi:hypothetical protein